MWLRNNALLLILGAALVAISCMIGVVRWAERQHLALAKNVYYEAVFAKEPELSSRMVAYVTHQRAKKNRGYWGGTNIHDVVYKCRIKLNGVKMCQFDWVRTRGPDARPLPGPMWELSKRIARDELAGRFIPPASLKEALSYNNPPYSGKANKCEFKTLLIPLGKAEPESQHVFYREPGDAVDKLLLPKPADVPECPPPKKPKKKSSTAAR